MCSTKHKYTYLFLVFNAVDVQCPLVKNDSNTFLFIVYRYNTTTGVFTVPAGKGGLYYFSASFVIEHSKFGEFEIQKKHQTLCSAYADARQAHLQTSCSAVTSADEGR